MSNDSTVKVIGDVSIIVTTVYREDNVVVAIWG
jgi:hypothetical protein